MNNADHIWALFMAACILGVLYLGVMALWEYIRDALFSDWINKRKEKKRWENR